MKKDCHLHPNLLREPWKAERFLARAIALGFEEVTFTDHMPLSVDDSFDRIPKGQVGAYCDAIDALAEKYRDRICLRKGIEIDYLPGYEAEIEAVLRAGRFDRVLGSSHLHVPGYGLCAQGLDGDGYVDKVLENSLRAVESGYFDALTHLDVYRWVFFLPRIQAQGVGSSYETARHEASFRRILSALEKSRVRLEVNSSIIRKALDHRGAHPEYAVMARDYDLRWQFGSDAHSPEWVGVYYDDLTQHPAYAFTFQKMD